MKYSVAISKQAEKDLKNIDKYQSKLIVNWLYANIEQCTDPRIHGKALTGDLGGFWRYRVGKYRIICEIDDNKLIVVTINIGHRRDIYR